MKGGHGATEEPPCGHPEEQAPGEMNHTSPYTLLSPFCPRDPRKGSDNPRRHLDSGTGRLAYPFTDLWMC